MSYINISELNFSYDKQKVLTDITLSIAENDIIAVLGPSGSGKTTLLRLLAGFEKPLSGDYELDGLAMNNLCPSDRKTGFVFQDLAPVSYTHLTLPTKRIV